MVILPNPLSFSSIYVFYIAFSVTFVFFPISKISFPIFPFISTKPLFHIHVICALVLLPCWPGVDSSSMHFSLKPFSFITATVTHSQSAFPMKWIIFPLTFVKMTITHFVFSYTVFSSIFVKSFIRAAIYPTFLALTMRLILFPIAFIFFSKLVCKHPIAVGMIIHPFALICISIRFSKLSKTPGIIFFPISLVFWAIWPNLRTFAFSLIIDNLSFVNGPISKSYYFSSTGAGGRELSYHLISWKLPTFIKFVVLDRLSYWLQQFIWTNFFTWSLFLNCVGQYIISNLFLSKNIAAGFTLIPHNLLI